MKMRNMRISIYASMPGSLTAIWSTFHFLPNIIILLESRQESRGTIVQTTPFPINSKIYYSSVVGPKVNTKVTQCDCRKRWNSKKIHWPTWKKAQIITIPKKNFFLWYVRVFYENYFTRLMSCMQLSRLLRSFSSS